MTPKLRTLLIVVGTVLPLDYLTKLWIVKNVVPTDPIRVIPGFFSITHARNPGAALGLLQDVHVFFFIALTVVALGLILSFFRKADPQDRLSATALGLVLAGALGNLIDRVVRHEVVDFLQFDLGLFIFPDFNVADSAIVIGVGLLLLDIVASETEEGVKEEAEP